jgi:uncharacterized protein YdeI (YjbR/CyaY-like superfamily)
MIKSEMNPEVDWFFTKDSKWQKEYEALRTIVLNCGLADQLKWGCPCYTFEDKNIVLIHGFKEYCALLFFKGALLKDIDDILVQQTKNVQSARQARFTSAQEIVKIQKKLKAYIFEAIEVEKAGLKVPLKKTREFDMPEEFEKELRKNPELKTAFKALTPGRQRGYLLYFSTPKQSKTRVARIEKYTPVILDGRGLND